MRRPQVSIAIIIGALVLAGSVAGVSPQVRAQTPVLPDCRTATAVQAPAAGVSVDAGLAGVLQPVTGFLADQRAQLGLPGMSVAIVLDQRVIYAGGFGCADLDRLESASPDTVFLMGSVTKMLTATMLMQLRDAGKLQLDDPVEKYAPGLHYNSPSGEVVSPTFRQLASHTSGLPDYLPNGPPLLPETDAELLQVLPTLTALSEPGTEALYSDLGYQVLGYALGVVAGEPYDDYIRGHILQPLAMSDSEFIPEHGRTEAVLQVLAGLPAAEAAQLVVGEHLSPVTTAQIVDLYAPEQAAQVLADLPPAQAGEVRPLLASQPAAEIGQDPLVGRLATPYSTLQSTTGGWLAQPVPPNFFVGATSPTGGLVSTVLDLAKLLMLQFRDQPVGGAQILSAESIAEMQQPVAQFDSALSFGTGWEIFSARPQTNGLTLVGKNGAVDGFQAQIQFVAGTKLGAVIAANIADASDPASFDKVDNLVSELLIRLAPSLAPAAGP